MNEGRECGRVGEGGSEGEKRWKDGQKEGGRVGWCRWKGGSE